MERLKNGIYATAMNMRIMNAYEEIEDEDLAESMLTTWFMIGVPDGNDLIDNISDFGEEKDLYELFKNYRKLCQRCKISLNFSDEVANVLKNILLETISNPYYNMV